MQGIRSDKIDSESITKVCIATTMKPKIERRKAFIQMLKDIAKENGVELLAVLGMNGIGAYNIGLKIKGENWKPFVESLTMALMPARYCLVNDEFEGFELRDI